MVILRVTEEKKRKGSSKIGIKLARLKINHITNGTIR